MLHTIFKRYTNKKKPLLLSDGLEKLLREFGFKEWVGRDRGALFGLNFNDLIELVDQIRGDQESNLFDHLRGNMQEFTHGTMRIPIKDLHDFVIMFYPDQFEKGEINFQ